MIFVIGGLDVSLKMPRQEMGELMRVNGVVGGRRPRRGAKVQRVSRGGSWRSPARDYLRGKIIGLLGQEPLFFCAAVAEQLSRRYRGFLRDVEAKCVALGVFMGKLVDVTNPGGASVASIHTCRVPVGLPLHFLASEALSASVANWLHAPPLFLQYTKRATGVSPCG